MEFAGKRVLVTGSTRGIGQALARRFLAGGARGAVNGRGIDSVASSMQALGGGEDLVAAAGDLSSAAGCEHVVKQALDGLGGLDILVNNAGLYPIASIEETNESMWDSAMDANVKSVFFCSKAALASLRESKGVSHQSFIDRGAYGICEHFCLLHFQSGGRELDALDGDGTRAGYSRELYMSNDSRQRHGLARFQPRRGPPGSLRRLRRSE